MKNPNDHIDNIRKTIEPVIMRMQGKSPDIKKIEFAALDPGMRALFAFWVLYGHSQNEFEGFFLETGYLLRELDLFAALKDGFEYYRDKRMLQIVKGLEKCYKKWGSEITKKGIRPAGQGLKISRELEALSKRYKAALPGTIEKINGKIAEKIGV
jgi:hypothetical protein